MLRRTAFVLMAMGVGSTFVISSGPAARASDSSFYDSKERDAYSAQLCIYVAQKKGAEEEIGKLHAAAKKYGVLNRAAVSGWAGLIITMDRGIKTSRGWLRAHGGALACTDPDVVALTDCFYEEMTEKGYCPDEAFERCGYESLDGPVTTCTW